MLVLSLSCFARLGYFPRSEDVPAAVVDHVRRCLKLEDGTAVLLADRSGPIRDVQGGRCRAPTGDAQDRRLLIRNKPGVELTIEAVAAPADGPG